ncbi:hypothetical protein [Actinobacillus pleuropneumoniae]|uniref:hypothetical protein n=1 Tax=Actinobacillus pleuropneumoniae TaxID=715 RepID=UPI0001E49E03|nr:hypothetical protein [Actinobacillus pleuropneumoniae]EFN01335.1 hypothetical protein appser12_3310 [Actinobacillus pleuropneumoniae serovar 12 str. 1096]UKH28077.1 DUF3791 domain-containing protein [Actinobacillus pleuropneumoniae]
MNANAVLLQRKYARIIVALSEKLNISLAEALDKFMFSKTYLLMREGIGDSHCLPDDYLVEDIIQEYR